MRRALEEARPHFEARRAGELSVTVDPDGAGADRYLIAVTNAGRGTYRDLLVRYEPLLLFAENFGLDTTHMPSEAAWIAGEPVTIETLPPGSTVRVSRKGFGTHADFDGPRETVFDVEYRVGLRKFTREDARWCPVTVRLPKARND